MLFTDVKNIYKHLQIIILTKVILKKLFLSKDKFITLLTISLDIQNYF